MTKRILLILTLLLNITLTFAAPFQNVEKILTQPDGSKLHCYASGDEFYNRLHDKNGFTIVQAENGYFVYATTNSNGEIIATQHIAGKSDPKALGLKPNITISRQEYLKKRDRMKITQTRNNISLNHGVYNNLVVFIKFKGDDDFRTTQTEIDSMFNHNGYYDISMNNYYKKATYNQLSMVSYCYPKADGDKVLAYEDIYPRKYYTPYNATTNPEGYKEEERGEREFALLKRAIEYIADEVPDTLNIDRNYDGNIDNVIFVVKGNTGDWSDLLWPHMWELHGEDVFIHNKRVMSFNFQLETSTYFTVSTLCHEMAHSLGFPDLYHYDEYFKLLSPTGPWDLMCTNSQPPQHTATYMKYKYGTWIDEIPEIEYGTYTIEANSWEGGRRNCYKIPTADPNQFYLIEYRNKNNIFEQGLPDGGLLIYRLDTRFNGCINFNGKDILDELYIFRPGGSHHNNGNIHSATFCAENNRTEFNSSTDPHPFLNLDIEDNEINICNISEKGDKMTFSYLPRNSEIIPTNLVANVNKNNYVELKWESVDNAESYNIYRDNTMIANNITTNSYKDELKDITAGHHIYFVTSNCYGEESFHSNKENIIIGDYCEYTFDMNCSGDNGWQGGEITLSFNNNMKDKHLTIYSGKNKTEQVIVPTGIEMSVSWTSGWDDTECSFTITNDGEEIYKSEILEEGILTTIDTEGVRTCVQPKNLKAETSDCIVNLHWNTPVENDYYAVMRNDEIIADSLTDNFYTDKSISSSGTYNYTVISKKENCTSTPSNIASATILKYNHNIINADASFENNKVKLNWNINPNDGINTINYDDDEYVTSIGNNSHNWGIMIPAENLDIYKNAKITAVEIYDASEATYTINIHSGDIPKYDNTIHNEIIKTTNANKFTTYELSKEVNFDHNKNLWLTAKSSSSSNEPIPCGKFIGLSNSNLIKVGSSWKSASDYDMNYSWLIRLHVELPENLPENITYNVYRQNILLASDLKSTNYIDKNIINGDVCYNIVGVYNNKNVIYSDDLCLTISSDKSDGESTKIFPNPTQNFVNINADNIKNVKIFSLIGNVIFDEDMSCDDLQLDMRKYDRGVYILHITTDSEIFTERIVTY